MQLPDAAGVRSAALAVGVALDQRQTEQLLGYMRDLMAVSVGCGVELMLHSSDTDQAAMTEAA